MRTRASMGKMVNKLTKREKADAFALIDRISRGVNQPLMREFVKPQLVASNTEITKPQMKRESQFILKEQTDEAIVVARKPSAEVVRLNEHRKVANSDMTFPDAFYEYFEVISENSKVG